jgi:predicted nuclease of predicted toxin-antitoxin system
MKFLLDENIPVTVLKSLEKSGFDAVSVLQYEGLKSDLEIIKTAAREKRIIITYDRDFGELVFKAGHKSYGIIYLRFEPFNPQIVSRQISILLEEKSIKFQRSFVVLEKDKVRVRPLP